MSDLSFDRAEVVSLLATDIASGLGEVFPPAGGFTVAEPCFEDDEMISNGRLTALAWTWTGKDSIGFSGNQPTGVVVTVRGLTLIEGRPRLDPPLFHRYVDWLDVLAQLGLSVSGRPTIAG